MIDHVRQIGNNVDFYVIGCLIGEFCQCFLHIVAELDNVVAFLHFERKQQGVVTIVADIAVRVFILPFNIGNVFYPDYISCRISINDLV